MSKAFTKEEDESEDNEPEIVQPSGSPCITKEGYQKLAAELDDLWRVVRPKITNEVMWAAAQGDRSENAEYIYGKRRLREIDRRLRFLKKRLDSVRVVEPNPSQHGRVFFGATVGIEDEEGKKSRYRIIGSDEVDLAKSCISVDSPLAKAMLGKSVGDSVIVRRPKGEIEVTILSIDY